MSATTRTLEMAALDELLHSDEPAHPAATEAYDPEPTTVAIPVTGVIDAVVVDEPEPGARSLAALTLSPRRAKTALMVLAGAAFAAGVNEGAIVALTPAIADDLGIAVAQVGLLATAFALTVVVAAVPLTMLAGRLSKRTTLTATFAVWTTGVVIAATAHSFAQLAAGRMVTAAAHGLFWGVVAPTAASLFAPHLRAMTVTRVMVGASVAGVIGTPLVTVVGETVGWHEPFWALAVLGLALVVALPLVLPGPVKDEHEDDDEGVDPPPVHHTIGDVPSLKHFLRVLVVTFGMQIGMAITWTYIVAYYTGAAGLPPGAVPLLFSLGGMVGVAATLLISPFLARHAVQTVGLGILGVVLAYVLYALAQPWSAVLGQVSVSAGWAVLVAGLLNWAMRHTPWRTDIGSSLYMVTANVGAAVGPLIGAVIVSTFGIRWLPIVSLAFSGAALVALATVDAQVVARLAVPRQVRMALERQQELRDKRREWRRRTEAPTHRPVAAQWAVGQHAAEQPGAERRSKMASAWNRPLVGARLARPTPHWPSARTARVGRRSTVEQKRALAQAAALSAQQEAIAAEAVRLAAEEHVAASDAVLAEHAPAPGDHDSQADAVQAPEMTPGEAKAESYAESYAEEQIAALQALDPYRSED
ncbi:MFS transporter [Demequina sp. NBRC 110054]|uniref:MFS transporter n=1 Tax=Demequina sp. NBRC 110054 TaxID=1570343 RepID=UPI001178AD2E|nr:MFS transporter [Demequina sp. NBRC 110054]